MAKQGNEATTYVLDDAELKSLIDREARERLGMSGDEFLQAYFEETLPDLPAATELAMMVKLSEDTIRSTVPSGIRGVSE